MQIDFKARNVLVTGGTRGIGRGIVEAFLEAGARVAVNGTTQEGTDKALSELGAGKQAVAVVGSVATSEGCRQVVDAAVAGLGGLDVLINNAGVYEGTSTEETDDESWDRVIDTNLKGVFFVTKYAVPHLRKTKGNIVNLSSVNALIGLRSGCSYAASKAGVIAITRHHAIEFAPDIRVNAICPGAIDSDMLRYLAEVKWGSVEAGYKVLGQGAAAMRRVGETHEIAGPCLYLASDLASFVTGSVHVVDGGEVVD